LLKIFQLTSKKELVHHCKSLVIHKNDFATIIIAAEQGKFSLKHKIHNKDIVPKHLYPNQNELDSLSKRTPGSPLTGDARKLFRKLNQMIENRRYIVGHLFFNEDLSRWHLFYFDQRDATKRRNHWKFGSHLHLINYLWPNYSANMIWNEFTTGNPKLKDSIHIRFMLESTKE
jgi:hypothetical protein